jgi:outer membrane protein TolC
VTAARPLAAVHALGRALTLTLALAATLVVQAQPAAPATTEAPTAPGSAPGGTGTWDDPALRELLAGVDDHPALRAAQRSVDAARAELRAVRFPIALEGEVGAQRPSVAVDAQPGVPQEAIDAAEDVEWTTQASVRARLRPFVAGDLADLEAQRRVALARAERRLRETRASLETAAVQAAAGLLAAEHGVRVAEAGVLLARDAASATELRVERGAARPRELERAELEVDRARERLRAAEASRRQAAARLEDLVGAGRGLEGLPEPPPAEGEDPAVLAAADDATLAAVGVGSATRGLLPTAQASYAWSTDDGAVSLSLETRTFQPTVGYETPNPLDDAASNAGAEAPPGLDVSVDGSLSVGLSFTLGAEGFAALDAARARLEAAEAGVEAARLEASRAADDRAEALRAAREELRFAREDVRLARADADDARRRAELGLASPLEAHRADLSALQADLSLLNARIDVLSARLRGYRELAIPLSEVLP